MINIGAVISGRYEIIEKVGTGGMADALEQFNFFFSIREIVLIGYSSIYKRCSHNE